MFPALSVLVNLNLTYPVMSLVFVTIVNVSELSILAVAVIPLSGPPSVG